MQSEVEPVSAELAERVRALAARAKMQDIWGPLADRAEARLRAREPQERLRLIRLEHALRDVAEGLL